MKTYILASLLLVAASSYASAADTLSEKVMKDTPGVTGAGTTANPTAKPDESSISQKAMKDAPGVTGGGATANATAKPIDSSPAEKQMQDAPGVAK